MSRLRFPTLPLVAFFRPFLAWALAASVLLCLLLSSCGSGGGGGNSAPPPASTITVSISPVTATVAVGGTQQFTPTVTGTSNTAVTWSVNGVSSGNVTVGTISVGGLYTAPALVPSPGSVSITATSAADSTKSATAQVSLKLKISITPTAPSVQLFHSQQFTATIVGVSNTAAQWSVNGTIGGSSLVGTIDATGLYVAPISLPNPASVSIQATSVADPTQSAGTTVAILSDTTPPQVTSINPADQSSGIALNSSVTITFNEQLDPSTLNSPIFTLTQGTTTLPITISYDPSTYTVTLTPSGFLSPLTSYSVTVGTQLKELGGNAMGAPFSASFTTVGGTSVASTVTTPAGLDPTSLSVISLQGQQTTPASDGTFTASVRPQGTTGVMAVIPGEAFGLFAVSIGNSGSASTIAQSRGVVSRIVNHTLVYSGKWQVTASPKLSQAGAQSLVLDFQTTAESLVFLSPFLFNGDPAKASSIMEVIAGEPKTQQLAIALNAAWNEPHPLTDSNVATAYIDAVSAVLKTLTQQSGATAPTATFGERRTGTAAAAEDAATGSTIPTYHSFDVCCIVPESFAKEGSSWIAPAHVTGPTRQNPNGNFLGWYLRTSRLPDSVDPTSIVPSGQDAFGNPDSPGPQPGEGDPTAFVNLGWFESDAFVDYVDVSALGEGISSKLLVSAGINSNALSANEISVPDSANGSSATYLLRFYSGSAPLVDSNEGTLVGQLPQGTLLSTLATVRNLSTPIFDVLSGVGLLPESSGECFEGNLVQDSVFSSVPMASSNSSDFNAYLSSVLGWGGFLIQDLAKHAVECGLTPELESYLEMHADLSLLGKALPTELLLDAIMSYEIAISAGKLTGVVADLFFKASAVDTAYVLVHGGTSAQVATIVLSPSNPSINVGSQQPFSYVAKDSAGNVLSNFNVTWTSSNNQVATIDGSGLATGVSPGTAGITVTAPSTGASASTLLTVNPLALDHLTIAPSAATIHTGQTLQFDVSGVASNGQQVGLGPITWSSNQQGVASVDQNGLVTGGSVGTAMISAASGGKSVSAQVSVVAATVNQVVVAPATSNLVVGKSLQFTATALDSAGNPIAGSSFTWKSSNSSVANVDSNGVSTGLAVGQATISASSGGLTGTAALTVVAAGTASVSQVLPSPVPALNGNQQLTINGSNFVSGATVTYYDPNNNPYAAKAASVVNSGQIVDTAFNDTAEVGTWKVTVTNPGASPSSAFSFTVAAAVLTPTVTSISPTSMTADGQQHTLTIYGTNFQSGDYVQFEWTVPPNNGVWNTGSTPSIASSTQMTVSMNPGTVTDTISVRVCNSAGTCTSGSQSVSVTAAVLTPTVTSISPTSYPASGNNQTMTINGSNFQSGATLTFVPPEGGTIASTASKLTFVSSNQLSYLFNDGSDVGTWKVTVNNPNGQHSNAWSFTVQ